MPTPENEARCRPEPATGECSTQLSRDVISPLGWISLHRKLLYHPKFRDSEFVHVWVYLLLSATWQPYEADFNGKKIILMPGQLVTGRHSIARATGVHESKVKRVLIRLKTDQQIDQQTGNTSSLITIRNWVLYQKSDQQIDHSSDQPVTTNNNIIRKEGSLGSGSERPTREQVIREGLRIGLAEWKAYDWWLE